MIDEKERKDKISKKLQSIIKSINDGLKLSDEDSYIYELVEGLNWHESVERNANCFIELADYIGLFDMTEANLEIAKLEERCARLSKATQTLLGKVNYEK